MHATPANQKSFPHRILGRNGPSVSALGLGCMGMSETLRFHRRSYESIATIQHALTTRDINFLNTADVYGQGRNEERWSGAPLRRPPRSSRAGH